MGDLVSICIPSYRRVHYLKRLMESIAAQQYRRFEVIITDDSGDDDSVERLAGEWSRQLTVVYKKNSPALGTPRNWMAGIDLAKGDWIKIMHDDDWFAAPDSLGRFMAAADAAPGAGLIFSGYNAVYETSGRIENRTISQDSFRKIQQQPFVLFAGNKLGPPSVLLFHRRIREYYSTELKWFVDIEYYARMLQKERGCYINSPLINMSYNDTQVTNNCFNNPSVEIPELLYILHRHGRPAATGLQVYDAWWRTLRNGDVLSPEALVQFAKGEPVPAFLRRMASHLQRIPASLLRVGPVSKLAMAISYWLSANQRAALSSNQY